jgi:hypothetical protein
MLCDINQAEALEREMCCMCNYLSRELTIDNLILAKFIM